VNRLAVVITLLLPSQALAHRDYEWVVTTVPGSGSETYAVVLHSTDGIMFGDPQKLIIRDSAGKTVAETHYTQGLVVSEPVNGRLLIFEVTPLWFWEGWAFKNGSFTPLPPDDTFIDALLANLSYNWFWYGCSTLICVAALPRFAVKLDIAPGKARNVAIIWLFGTLVYGSLSILLIVGLALPLGLLLRWCQRLPQSETPHVARYASSVVFAISCVLWM
jgi:hypothetical protein